MSLSIRHEQDLYRLFGFAKNTKPIFRMPHCIIAGTIKTVTIKGSDGCKLLAELHHIPEDHEIIKKRFSAFFKTDLEKILKQLGVDTIIVAGVNTMTCVRVSAIDAYQRDYDIILAVDCVDAYDKEQHENSLKYLQYSVAKGKTNEEIKEMIKPIV